MKFAARILCLIVVAATLGNQALAQDVITYFQPDTTGSPIAATDANGNLLWREDYAPYGERLRQENSPRTNRMWFTGHHQDEDSGIIYAGARHYDPVIGRFMSVDPVGVDPGNGFSFNRYVYGNDNPYRYKDPDGQVPVETFWDIGNVIYDVGKISVGWTIGNQALVVEGTGDLIVDGVSVLVPYVPAGSTKVARLGVKATEVAAKRKAIDPNRLQPIFGKSEHLLDDFVRESGGAEQAYRRIEDAANAALRDGKLVPGPKGILPSGNGGPLIDVDGTQIRLIGGRVKDGVVELSSASRKGVP